MKRVSLIIAFVLWIGAGALWAQEKIVVGGSGGVFDEVKETAEIYQAKNPSQQIEVMKESMATGATMEAIKAGRLTMGLVGGSFSDEEKGKLVYRPVSRALLGVGVHKSLPLNGMTESQACDVFSGKIKSWSEVGGGEGKILVLTVIKKNNVLMDSMRKHMACFKDLSLTPDAVTLNRTLELQDAVDHRPGTVGVIMVTANMNEARPNLKALAINGVVPSLETAQSGKYHHFQDYGVVTVGEPQGSAKRFLEFLASSPESQKIFARRGMIMAR
jgi:phosphate transport system substrate-binding protein